MKQVTIISEYAARKLKKELQTASEVHTVDVMKYCTGKYRVDQDVPFVGRVVNASDDVLAIWPTRRKDKDGPYIQLMCMVYA